LFAVVPRVGVIAPRGKRRKKEKEREGEGAGTIRALAVQIVHHQFCIGKKKKKRREKRGKGGGGRSDCARLQEKKKKKGAKGDACTVCRAEGSAAGCLRSNREGEKKKKKGKKRGERKGRGREAFKRLQPCGLQSPLREKKETKGGGRNRAPLSTSNFYYN